MISKSIKIKCVDEGQNLKNQVTSYTFRCMTLLTVRYIRYPSTPFFEMFEKI